MDRFFIDESRGNFAFVTNKDEITHIAKTLRMEIGDKLEVFDGKGFVAVGEIEDISKKEIKIKILENLDENRELGSYITVYQGLPKAQKMEFITQKLTEIGVSKIVPIDFERSVKKIKDKEDKQIERWQRIALEASKQSKRTYIPEISNCLSVRELVENIKNNDITLLCYESEININLKQILSEINKNIKVGIIVGPEGGITEAEHKALSAGGAKSISLGRSILRTETASIFATSIVAYELE